MRKGIHYGTKINVLLDEVKRTLKSVKTDIENDIRLHKLGNNPVATVRKKAFTLDIIDVILLEIIKEGIYAFDYRQFYTLTSKDCVKKIINILYKDFDLHKVIKYDEYGMTVIQCAIYDITCEDIGKLNKNYIITWETNLYKDGEIFGEHLIAEAQDGVTQEEIKASLERDGFLYEEVYCKDRGVSAFAIKLKNGRKAKRDKE